MTEPFQRYLRLLGIVGRPSGLDGLRTLVRRHLAAVPFENISKLLLFHRQRTGRATTLTEFLDGIEYSDLGGTCYTNNLFLTELLRNLGYDAGSAGRRYEPAQRSHLYSRANRFRRLSRRRGLRGAVSRTAQARLAPRSRRRRDQPLRARPRCAQAPALPESARLALPDAATLHYKGGCDPI
jgi:arylamine N-acetyltransferase